jgi:tetratricopeptide (TPR) repeat protein
VLTMGRVDEAIAQYRKALELRPDFAAAATMLRIAEAQRPR